jgi:HTH-type transcriptional regulator/antitoxin MqsA
MSATATRPCPICGEEMNRDIRNDAISYKGLSAIVEQPGWYCAGCGEAVLTEADIKTAEPAFFDLRARGDGLLTAAEIRDIRKRLKLTQRKAGELLGGGERAFQKYESRQVMVSKAMSNLLRILDRHPENLAEIKRCE